MAQIDENKELRVLGEIKFPDGFNDAGGKTFEVVYDTLKDFVYFSRHWEKATGLFKHWARYIELRDKRSKKDVSVAQPAVFEVSPPE